MNRLLSELFLRLPLAFALLPGVAFTWNGITPDKSACSEKTMGQFWPVEANTSRTAAREAEQRGELYICTKGVWKYTWQPLTVHVSELARKPKAPRVAEPARTSHN